MSVDHKRPMYAFVMVALICGLVIADQVRSDAQWGPERPSSIVAGDVLEPRPTSDPPVPGQPRRTTGEAATGGTVEPPTTVAPARRSRPAPEAPGTTPAAPQGGAPEGGAPGSSAQPVEVVAPAPEPQAPDVGVPGQAGPVGALAQLDLGEAVQQVLQAATSSGARGQGHAYGQGNGPVHARGKGNGHAVAGVRGADDEREPRNGTQEDRTGAHDPVTGDAEAGEGQDSPDAVIGPDASDEADAPVLDPVPVLPGWLEDAVSPRSGPAPPRP